MPCRRVGGARRNVACHAQVGRRKRDRSEWRSDRCKTILASIETLLYLFEMETVTLSSKYQVVIPRSVRNRLGLRPGMKLQVIEYNGRVEFLPVRKPAELRGLLRGLEPVIEREPG